MAFDDGATDGQSDPHPVILSCVESFKKSIRYEGVETDSGVLHGETHVFAFISPGSDCQLPWTIVDSVHGVRGVPNQVENDLLDLNAIASDEREVVGQRKAQNDAVSLKFT
jgi:hypothetical protein